MTFFKPLSSTIPYLDILESVNIGILIFDKDGYYVYVNKAYCLQCERPADFFSNMTIHKLKRLGYLKESVWEKVMATRSTVSALVTLNNTRPGYSFDALTTGVPIFDSHGKIEYVFTVQEPMHHLRERLQSSETNRYITLQPDTLNFDQGDAEIIAESPQMKKILAMLDNIAETDASVLISGASGTGKEVIANYIHNKSTRKGQSIISINCASIPENLLESELFGYEKGAFSGASEKGKIGLILAANQGTLFLDEINSMPLTVQAKVLRVLENRQITPLGGIKSIPVDFRLICTTNEDLHALISQNAFRSDLYYRINVVSVNIPPLCERREDIIPLSLCFIRRYCEKYGLNKVFSALVLHDLKNMEWPGNVRELKNLIERMIITSPRSELKITHIDNLLLDFPADLPENAYRVYQDQNVNMNRIDWTKKSTYPDYGINTFTHSALSNVPPVYLPDKSYREHMDKCEYELFLAMLQDGLTPLKISSILKIDLSNVYRKLKKHNLKY